MIFDSSKSLASFLGVSESVIKKWREAEMPFEQVGFGYRYELEACLSWLVGRGPRYRRYVENLHARIAKEESDGQAA